MLVLSRRSGESLRIQDTIQIQILSIHNGKVRLGITAPDEVSVDREEVALRRREMSLEIEVIECPEVMEEFHG